MLVVVGVVDLGVETGDVFDSCLCKELEFSQQVQDDQSPNVVSVETGLADRGLWRFVLAKILHQQFSGKPKCVEFLFVGSVDEFVDFFGVKDLHEQWVEQATDFFLGFF